MISGINELALAIGLAAGFALIARWLKQPLILAYLAAGAVIGAFGLFDVGRESFQLLSNLGIMFLLFLVGLEINYTSLKIVGRSAIIIGLGQVIFTAVIGFFIARGLNFEPLTALYIAVALTFSSTIIIVKLLSDKKDIGSLYGKLSVGVMLVQDIIAIFILMVLSGLQTGDGFLAPFLSTVIRGIALFAVLLWLGRKILPFLFDRVARSQELLFLVSAAWLFLLASLSHYIGLSIEIAGLLAGLSLANSAETYQIASKMKPLRDFFILIFFIILGGSFVFTGITSLGLPMLILSLFVLIGNPFIVLIIMGLLGYRKRTSFFTGITVAQISEFSLILAALGFRLGHIDQQTVSLITVVGVITIITSTYLIIHADKIYKFLSFILSIFERRSGQEQKLTEVELKKPIVLIGYHRTGKSLAQNLNSDDLLIIDFDPETINELMSNGKSFILGDISDPDIMEKIISGKLRLIVSTSPDFEENMILVTRVRGLRRRPKVVVRAESNAEAKILYRAGADYVLLPHFSSGHHLGKSIASDPSLKILQKLKKKDFAFLKLR